MDILIARERPAVGQTVSHYVTIPPAIVFIAVGTAMLAFILWGALYG